MGETHTVGAREFLQTSRAFIDTDLTEKQALQKLGQQVTSMLQDGTWAAALTYMRGENKRINMLPHVRCTDETLYDGTIATHCTLTAGLLDAFNGSINRAVYIQDNYNPKQQRHYIRVSAEDFRNGFGDSDTTVEIPKMTEVQHLSLPFPDNDNPEYDRFRDFPQGSTRIGELSKLIKMAMRSPEENASMTHLILEYGWGGGMDAIALRSVSAFPNVNTLYVDLYMKDEELKPLAANHNIETLYLGSSGIKGPGLESVSQLPKLSKLDLGSTDLGGDDLAYLTSASIKQLRLGEGMKDEGFKHLAKLPALQVLQIDRGIITAAGLKQLAASKSLKHLVLNAPHGVAPEDVDAIRKALPGVKVEYFQF